MTISLAPADWLDLLAHFLSLSLLAVGGAISTAPDMHRYLVDARHWLSEGQFTSSIALAQAAPGPNVLFVALMGWNVGLNAGGGPAGGWPAYGLALLGVAITLQQASMRAVNSDCCCGSAAAVSSGCHWVASTHALLSNSQACTMPSMVLPTTTKPSATRSSA